MACPACDWGAEETLNHFLKECQGLSAIRDSHEVKVEDKIEELLLFYDLDQKKIEKRKKYCTWSICGGRGGCRFDLGAAERC